MFSKGDKANREPDYRYEIYRLQSLDSYPASRNDRAKLAAAGFYYIGEDDTVKCFECEAMISDWSPYEDPMECHKRYVPECRFVQGLRCGNIPIGNDLPCFIPKQITPWQTGNRRSGVDFDENCPECLQFHGLLVPKPPRIGLPRRYRKDPFHSAYANYENRLYTFQDWPKEKTPTGQALAEAGFFADGKDDCTLCHSCGGGLKNWATDDDPWTQHAVWFPKCEFLIAEKGHSFIRRCNRRPAPIPAEDRSTMTDLPECILPGTEHFNRLENLTAALNDATLEDEDEDEQVVPELRTVSPPHVYDYVEPADVVASADEVESPMNPSPPPVHSKAEVTDSVNENLCQSCRQSNVNTILSPCRHSITCEVCTKMLRRCMSCFLDVKGYTKIVIEHEYKRKNRRVVIIPSSHKNK